MGGSILGANAIYSFLKNKIKKTFIFIDTLNVNENLKNNKKKFLNLKIVKKIISEKKDIFNRSVKFDKIKNINKLPNYIIKNKKKFKLYMI